MKCNAKFLSVYFGAQTGVQNPDACKDVWKRSILGASPSSFHRTLSDPFPSWLLLSFSQGTQDSKWALGSLPVRQQRAG